MNEAPERIWAWRQTTITRWSGHGEGKDTTEYVRADLFDAKDKCIAELEAKLAKAVEVLIVYESNLFSFATATDDTADEAGIFLDRDRGKLARNVLAEIKGETE